MMICDGKNGLLKCEGKPARYKLFLGVQGHDAQHFSTVDLCDKCREKFKTNIVITVAEMKKDAKP